MIRKDKRSRFSGAIGEEFNEIWAALAANQIIPANGLEVKQTSTGTVVAPSSSSVAEEGKIIETTIERYYPSYDGSLASVSSSTPSNSTWQDVHEAWFTDSARRIIATPPFNRRRAVLLKNHGNVQAEVDNNVFNSDDSTTATGDKSQGWKWPTEILNTGANSGLWTLDKPYVYGEKILAVKLEDAIEVPCGETLATNAGSVDYQSHVSRYDATYGYLIWADYIDLNLCGREWSNLGYYIDDANYSKYEHGQLHK